MSNIKRARFTALDASINDAFKVSNDLIIPGWHAGMHVIVILDQPSTIYGQPTPAILETNNAFSAAPTWPRTPLKSFPAKLKNALKKRSLATIHIWIGSLLLTTGLYIRPFEKWDRLTAPNQTWIALCTMIQEAFQWHLNAMAPTAGHRGYAPAMPHQKNAFGILGETMANSDDEYADTVATQVAALTYQSELTALMAANSLQQAEQQLVHLASQKNLMHENMHQITAQVNASFNQRDAGRRRLASFNSGGCGQARNRCQ
jgi:hypothetical protein